MSQWADYVNEVKGGTVTFIERDYGFISYSFPLNAPDCIYAEDVYIVPEHRRSKKALELVTAVEDAGRKANKQYVLAVISVASFTSVESLKAHLAVGFVPVLAESGSIWLKRPIVLQGEI